MLWIIMGCFIGSDIAYAAIKVPQEIIKASNDVAKNASIKMAVYAKYPEEALEAKVDGYATLAFIITEVGRANDVQILAAQPAGVFELTSKTALSLWSFSAATSETIDCGYAKQGAIITFKFNHDGNQHKTTISGFGLINNPSPEPEVEKNKREKFDRSIKAIKRVEPDYPLNAARFRAEGLVVLKFDVPPDGEPTNIEVLQSIPPHVFDRSATKAMSKWQFKPAVENGKEITSEACQTLIFRIPDDSKISELSD